MDKVRWTQAWGRNSVSSRPAAVLSSGREDARSSNLLLNVRGAEEVGKEGKVCGMDTPIMDTHLLGPAMLPFMAVSSHLTGSLRRDGGSQPPCCLEISRLGAFHRLYLLSSLCSVFSLSLSLFLNSETCEILYLKHRKKMVQICA